LPGLVVRETAPLIAFGIDKLAEVALLIEQADAHDRDSKVVSGLELISGNVAETTRVNRQRLAQAEFHAEVGPQVSGACGYVR